MKHVLAIAVLSLLTSSVFAARSCKVQVDESSMMPQGSMETPMSILQVLKDKGYKATMAVYPRATVKGEYTLVTSTKCLNNVFNPFFVKCDTTARLYNEKDERVAEGLSSNNVSFGAYSGDPVSAARRLPDCKDL